MYHFISLVGYSLILSKNIRVTELTATLNLLATFLDVLSKLIIIHVNPVAETVIYLSHQGFDSTDTISFSPENTIIPWTKSKFKTSFISPPSWNIS
tara:strand:- start:120 stop:407 length:288 start_codon:yes stop_codon:yes gene_type:complete